MALDASVRTQTTSGMHNLLSLMPVFPAAVTIAKTIHLWKARRYRV